MTNQKTYFTINGSWVNENYRGSNAELVKSLSSTLDELLRDKDVVVFDRPDNGDFAIYKELLSYVVGYASRKGIYLQIKKPEDVRRVYEIVPQPNWVQSKDGLLPKHPRKDAA